MKKSLFPHFICSSITVTLSTILEEYNVKSAFDGDLPYGVTVHSEPTAKLFMYLRKSY